MERWPKRRRRQALAVVPALPVFIAGPTVEALTAAGQPQVARRIDGHAGDAAGAFQSLSRPIIRQAAPSSGRFRLRRGPVSGLPVFDQGACRRRCRVGTGDVAIPEARRPAGRAATRLCPAAHSVPERSRRTASQLSAASPLSLPHSATAPSRGCVAPVEASRPGSRACSPPIRCAAPRGLADHADADDLAQAGSGCRHAVGNHRQVGERAPARSCSSR